MLLILNIFIVYDDDYYLSMIDPDRNQYLNKYKAY